MGEIDRRRFRYSWEEAIEILRRDSNHRDLIFNSYLTADLSENCRRFYASKEFAAVLALLNTAAPGATKVLDIPGGNGIAAYAFAMAGFAVTTVEPNPSNTVGRGAIAAVLRDAVLTADIVEAFGECLPFPANYFDIVYVRQGLHHAADLRRMLTELSRVLRPGGVFLACREHVVDDYGASLQSFLDTQVDHQLYGGEHAFTLADYRAAIEKAGLVRVSELDPLDSIINLFPSSPELLRQSLLDSRPGRLLSLVLPKSVVARIGLWWVKRSKPPGRLYSFLALKPLARS
jgi:SAM-dependent methyltransferase